METTSGDFRKLPVGFRLLLAGVKHQDHYSFYEGQVDHLWKLVEFFDCFQGTVVTFNGKRFDVPVLDQHLQNNIGRKINITRHYDILWEVTRATGYRISLRELARLNLERTKMSWNHALNERVWRETPHQLVGYNQQDLDLTAAIYELILNDRPISLGSRSTLLRHID